MKTRFFKMMVVLAVMNVVFGIGTQVFAADVNHLYHNVEVENGKVVCKYIYKECDSQLTPFMKQLFTYNVDGNLKQKTIQTWNENTGKWTTEKVYEYSYDDNTTTIVMLDIDKKGNKTPSSKYSYTTSNDDSSKLLCSSISSWNEKTGGWKTVESNDISLNLALLAEDK